MLQECQEHFSSSPCPIRATRPSFAVWRLEKALMIRSSEYPAGLFMQGVSAELVAQHQLATAWRNHMGLIRSLHRRRARGCEG